MKKQSTEGEAGFEQIEEKALELVTGGDGTTGNHNGGYTNYGANHDNSLGNSGNHAPPPPNKKHHGGRKHK